MGNGIKLEIIFPDRELVDVKDTNISSIVARLSVGAVSFLFTGDSPRIIERYLARDESSVLLSDVLKVGHHGSKTSTDPVFIKAVDPLYAVISSGEQNRYGHPHNEVIEILRENNIKILRTNVVGDIVFVTDGWNLWRL